MTMQSNRVKRRTGPSPGVCGNCVHGGNCVFQRTSLVPILLCEEHEVEPVIEPVHVTTRPEPITPSVSGICGTCDNFATCVLRSNEHITYHCEHYR